MRDCQSVSLLKMDLCNGIINPHKYQFSGETVTFYKFELVNTGKLNKKGKPKKRTRHVDYNVIDVQVFLQMLCQKSKEYMEHRYDAVNDKRLWPSASWKRQQQHLDFSENLKEKPEYEPQDAHFSGAQHSLHCAFVYSSPVKDDIQYFYHFSDELQHNWQFTITIILNLIDNALSESIAYRFKSDNCRVQYKRKIVFGVYKELSMTLKKRLYTMELLGMGRGCLPSVSSAR